VAKRRALISATRRQASQSPEFSQEEKQSSSDSEWLLLNGSRAKANRLVVDVSEEPPAPTKEDNDPTPRINLAGGRAIHFSPASSLDKIFVNYRDQPLPPTDDDISLSSPPSENTLQLDVGWPTTTWGDESTRVQSPEPAWPLPPLLEQWPTPPNVTRPIHDEFFPRNDNVGWIGQEPTSAGTGYIFGDAWDHIKAYQNNRPTYLREITYVNQDCKWLSGQIAWICNTKGEIYDQHRQRVEELKGLGRDHSAVVESHQTLCHWIEGFETLTR
jgi:hypothetical protein